MFSAPMPPDGPTALVVDDDDAITVVIKGLLRQEGVVAVCVRSGEEALATLSSRAIDVVLTDLRMPSMDGMTLLRRVSADWPEVPVIMMTAYASVPHAVEAMKLGAADFVTKPFDAEELALVLRKAIGKAQHAAREVPRGGDDELHTRLSGRGEAMRECQRVLARAARSDATALILGESGTGKELAARALHDSGARKAGPFVAVNCAALPESLLESELFGHEKGAFTGAVARKPGRVEMAEGGTLFLDEIGDVPLPMQVKLLRLVQEREYSLLGGGRARKADVRFVAATHRDLDAMVARGEFREDLYYRLAVVVLRLPPLRARVEDIADLARDFCARVAARHGRVGVSLDGSALAALERVPWPGNVRQLQNFIERLVVMSDGPLLTAEDVARESKRSAPFQPAAVKPAPERDVPAGGLVAHMREVERDVLLAAMARTGNNRTLAARVLGLSRRTFYNKLEEHGLL